MQREEHIFLLFLRSFIVSFYFWDACRVIGRYFFCCADDVIVVVMNKIWLRVGGEVGVL